MKERRKLHSIGYLSMQLLCHLNICEYRFVHRAIRMWALPSLICIFKHLRNDSTCDETLKVDLYFLPPEGKLGNFLSIIWRLGKNFTLFSTFKPFCLIFANTDMLNDLSRLNCIKRSIIKVYDDCQ
jgi:hypothetical protein